jgi:hypothetical protein
MPIEIASGMGERKCLLLVEAQRVRHDERRGAGDGDEADLEVLLLQRALLLLRHGLQAGHGQHAGDGGHGRALAHGAQEAAAHRVLREQGLDQRGLDKLVAVGLEFTREAALAQLDGGSLGMVVGHRVVAAAAALEHQRAVGIEGREEFGHGTPRKRS